MRSAPRLVHQELSRRFGSLPLWLAEGVACAGEERAFGEIWANWYRDSFVSVLAHGGWRNDASRLVAKNQRPLPDLYAYPARPFDEDLARFAFAFAVYGLEADREGFARLLAGMAEDSRAQGGGRYEPAPARVQELVSAAFGADFERDFRSWWAKPPKTPR